MGPLSGLDIVLAPDSSSPGTPQDADEARIAGVVRKETDCLGLSEAEQQQTFQRERFADGSSAVIRKQSRADTESCRPLLPSALDRRICPEPVQVRKPAGWGLQPHFQLLLTHVLLHPIFLDL